MAVDSAVAAPLKRYAGRPTEKRNSLLPDRPRCGPHAFIAMFHVSVADQLRADLLPLRPPPCMSCLTLGRTSWRSCDIGCAPNAPHAVTATARTSGNVRMAGMVPVVSVRSMEDPDYVPREAVLRYSVRSTFGEYMDHGLSSRRMPEPLEEHTQHLAALVPKGTTVCIVRARLTITRR